MLTPRGTEPSGYPHVSEYPSVHDLNAITIYPQRNTPPLTQSIELFCSYLPRCIYIIYNILKKQYIYIYKSNNQSITCIYVHQNAVQIKGFPLLKPIIALQNLEKLPRTQSANGTKLGRIQDSQRSHGIASSI